MIIHHQYLTLHKHAAIALPCTVRLNGKVFDLVQKDKSIVKVEYVDAWTWHISEINKGIVLLALDLTPEQLIYRIKQKYEAFASLPENEQYIHLVIVKKL